MNIYVCPMCNANLHRARRPGKGYCPDCRAAYDLKRCVMAERIVGPEERGLCLEAPS